MYYILPLLLILAIFPIALYRKRIESTFSSLTLSILYGVISVFFVIYGLLNQTYLWYCIFFALLTGTFSYRYYRATPTSAE